jgi:cob(I)alamin adenosyltransferase
MQKIYTKTGDEGETSLLGGKRVSKSCVEMEVIGELDELNAALGIVLSLRGPASGGDETIPQLVNFLQSIQRDLFKIGSEIASLQTPLNENIEKIGENKIVELENKIDEFWSELPELKSFILPGGSAVGAHLHLARTVCRRAERRLVAFGKSTPVRPELYKYLNRLSDYLFVAARWVNYKEGINEEKV